MGAFAFSAAACTGTPANPSPTIMCPGSISVVSPSGEPVPVTYPEAIASGGAGVSATCTPASGSTFAIGTTAVSCSASAAGQQAACTFNVTVAPPPRITATRFLAFGDSITYGSRASTCPGALSSSRALRLADALSLERNAVGPGHSYPAVLQNMLRERYTAQAAVVDNEGLPGDMVIDPIDSRRFVNALGRYSPEVLLLQEGINDLHNFGFTGRQASDGISLTVAGLRNMIREARRRNVTVFVGTLLPQRPNGCRAFAIPPRGSVDLITPANDQIRSMAAAEGAELVDLFDAFDENVDVLIGSDGLHPTDGGYATIATTFFASIQRRLEVPGPGSSSARR